MRTIASLSLVYALLLGCSGRSGEPASIDNDAQGASDQVLADGMMASTTSDQLVRDSDDAEHLLTDSKDTTSSGQKDYSHLQDAIDEAIVRVEADQACNFENTSAACESSEITYLPSASASRNSEGVLVVDSIPYLSPSMLRYQSRLAGYFEVAPGGNIRQPDRSKLSWHVPQVLAEVVTRFDPAGRDYIPAWVLEPLGNAIADQYGIPAGFAHGWTVHDILTELIPEHSIYLMHHEFLDVGTLICNPNNLNVINSVSQAFADSLSKFLRDHNIRFVNFSAGLTSEIARRTWTERGCQGEPSREYLRSLAKSFEPVAHVLFASPGVITTMAAAGVWDRADSPFDVQSDAYPNRLRVGYFNAYDSRLDNEGRGDTSSFTGVPNSDSVDLYINSGCRGPNRECNQSHLQAVTNYGMWQYTLPTAGQTSWMAPLALAEVIYHRQSKHLAQPMTDNLIRQIKQEMTPEGRRFQDPLKHKQFEAYRLGYYR